MNVTLRPNQSKHSEKTATVQEGAPYGGRPAEKGGAWSLLVRLVRVLGYVFLLALAFAVSVGLGAGISVGMEFLVGWPDTRLY